MKFIALALVIGLRLFGQTAVTTNSSILMAGNAAGKEVETYGADGSIKIEYSFNDRGRGPEIRGIYQMDARGFPVSVDLTGHDYLKAPVDEHLAVKDGEARWKSTGEQGESAAKGYYVSAAKVVKADADLGSIEPGKKADLVLVEGNPMANISDIRNMRIVIKDGVEYKSAELYQALGIKP